MILKSTIFPHLVGGDVDGHAQGGDGGEHFAHQVWVCDPRALPALVPPVQPRHLRHLKKHCK